MPIVMGESVPEPDIAVVKGSPYDYQEQHPETAILIVEISDSTLTYDREVKAPLYARSGISDYWIVNINERRLEVYRNPVPDDSERFGWRYKSILLFREDQSVAPLSAQSSAFNVSELLPR